MDVTPKAEATLTEIIRLLREREAAASQLASIDKRIAALATGATDGEQRKRKTVSRDAFSRGCGL